MRHRRDDTDVPIRKTDVTDTDFIDSSVDFFDKVSKHPILTAAEEQRLAHRLRAGDVRARDELIRCNARLVMSIAMPYRHRGLEMDDLFQEGVIGLGKAIDRFNPDKGYRLSTYATWWIMQAVQRAAAHKSDTIRVPISVQGRERDVARHREKNPDATDIEVALALGIGEHHVSGAGSHARVSASLNEDTTEDTLSWADTVRDHNAPDPLDMAMRESASAPVLDAIHDLPEPMRSVIRLRFGIGGDHPLSINQVREELGVPGHQVSKMQRDGLNIIRDSLGSV